MFVITSHVIGIYSVFPVGVIDALFWCLRPFTSPYQPHPPVHYLHTVSMVCVTSVVEVCEVLEFGLCACVSLFLSICEMTTRSKCATHFWWWPPSVHHVPRCGLRQFSKSFPVVLLGLGLWLGLELGSRSVLVYSISIRFELRFHVKTARKTSSHIFPKNRKSITQHTSINKLSACHRYELKCWAWQPLRYEGGKYDIKWSISSTMSTVRRPTFFTRNMTSHLVHWPLTPSDT